LERTPTSLESAQSGGGPGSRPLRVLLIVTFRAGSSIPPWIGRPHVTALTINRLAQREVETMIDNLVGNEELPRVIRAGYHQGARTAIPLFVEEMTKGPC